MRSKIYLILVLLVCLSVSACSKNSGSDQAQGADNGQTAGQGFRRPDFGQPDREADVMGVVENILGNEVRILKIDRPQRQQEQEGQESGNNEQQTEGRSLTFNGQTPGQGNFSGSGNGRGMMGGFRGQEGEGFDSSQMIERMKSMSTGEDTITIPVGIQMLKSEVDENGKPTMVEASLTDIKANTMIRAWLDEDGSKQANFVLIMQ